MASGKILQLQLLLSMISIGMLVFGMVLKVADYYIIIFSLSSMMGRC